jgi:spermidine synthase
MASTMASTITPIYGDYNECEDELNVTMQWHNCTLHDSITTRRGTRIEMVTRPSFGLSCFMDNSIQSSEYDEKKYHQFLIKDIFTKVLNPEKINKIKNVCIIGGGEGATAREVLKYSSVEKVDMIEWDEEVVELFKNKYPQWSQGAWNDSRLHLEFKDAFEVANEKRKYDAVIVDLFDPCPEMYEKWNDFISKISCWVERGGTIAIYSGMDFLDIEGETPVQKITKNAIQSSLNMWRNIPVEDDSWDSVCSDKILIPSFMGQATFVRAFRKDY